MIIYNKESKLSTNTCVKSSAQNDSCMNNLDWCRYYFKSKSGAYYSAESNTASRGIMKAELEEIIGEELYD